MVDDAVRVGFGGGGGDVEVGGLADVSVARNGVAPGRLGVGQGGRGSRRSRVGEVEVGNGAVLVA